MLAIKLFNVNWSYLNRHRHQIRAIPKKNLATSLAASFCLYIFSRWDRSLLVSSLILLLLLHQILVSSHLCFIAFELWCLSHSSLISLFICFSLVICFMTPSTASQLSQSSKAECHRWPAQSVDEEVEHVSRRWLQTGFLIREDTWGPSSMLPPDSAKLATNALLVLANLNSASILLSLRTLNTFITFPRCPYTETKLKVLDVVPAKVGLHSSPGWSRRVSSSASQNVYWDCRIRRWAKDIARSEVCCLKQQNTNSSGPRAVFNSKKPV